MIGGQDGAQGSSRPKREKYRVRFTAPDARALKVDDTEINRFVFSGLLKMTQMRVDTAANGGEGVRLAGENAYDIIFLDHMMPGKDGIETLKEIRSAENGINRNTPAICLTANAISGARDKYMAAGFDNYLAKPVEPGRLEEMIRTYLPAEKVRETE